MVAGAVLVADGLFSAASNRVRRRSHKGGLFGGLEGDAHRIFFWTGASLVARSLFHVLVGLALIGFATAGWYAAPEGSGSWEWWDGTRWTGHRSSGS